MRKIFAIIPFFVLAACADSGQTDTSTQTATMHVKADSVSSVAAPLPDVPADISKPSEKADYVMLHFWDAVDFGDPSTASDTMRIEQTFADFIELLPHSSSVDAASAAIGRLYQAASATPESYRLMAEIADKYLYTEDSPMRNRRLYTYFVQSILDGDKLTHDQKAHYRAQLSQLQQSAQ